MSGKKFLKSFKSFANVSTKSTGSLSNNSNNEEKEIHYHRFNPNTSSLFSDLPKLDGEFFGKDIDEYEYLPKFVKEFMDFIRKNGSKSEGLFRKNGNKELIDEVVEVLDMGEDFPMKEIYEHCNKDIHTVCGVLKYYFKVMPNVLLNYELYDEWLVAAEIKDEMKKEKAVRSLLKKLSKLHFELANHLFLFLNYLSQTEISSKTKMGSDNLALVFGPNVLRPKVLDLSSFKDGATICVLVQYIIENANLFFMKKEKEKKEKK